MQILARSQSAIAAGAAIALLIGCSGAGPTSIAPKPQSPHTGTRFVPGDVPAVVDPFDKLYTGTARNIVSRDSCPATGLIVYVSDYVDSVIDIFAGNLAGQAPCAQIATASMVNPVLLYVKTDTHDLYVANFARQNILVFHRGETSPYNTYTDPSGQNPYGVTVAKDGTVIASNSGKHNGPPGTGSISTWIPGPSGGKFVGNFPMTNDKFGLYVTAQKNGTIFYNDVDATSGLGALWSLRCPAGACGVQTQVAGVSFMMPGGMGSDDADDLLVTDSYTGTAETFNLPNPSPSTFPMLQRFPIGMAINRTDHHWFAADADIGGIVEYSYPKGKVVGSVLVDGQTIGVAVDPGHKR
jgi:hypothetical protein